MHKKTMRSAFEALILVAIVTACGGGGDAGPSGNTAATSGPATSATGPGSGSTGSAPGPGGGTTTASPPSTSGTSSSDVTPVSLGETALAYSGPYISTYRSTVNNIFAVAYNPVADELIVVGNVLAQGLPGVQGLDPTSFAVRWSMSMPATGDVIAVSDDGSKAFIGLPVQQSVVQVDLVTHAIDVVFPIAGPGQVGYAGDIAVRPGHPTQIAVTQIAGYPQVLAPHSYGTMMFDNGVLLPDVVNDSNSGFFATGSALYTGSVKLQFSGPDVLIGFSDFTNVGQVERYAVGPTGLTLTSVQRAPWDNNITAKNGLLYFSQGVVAPIADVTGATGIARCNQSNYPGYQVAIPDPTRPEVLCVTSVPQTERLGLKDIELELSAWTVDGVRVTRRARLNLRDVIQIPLLATPEVELKKMLALPNGQLVLHVNDYQSARELLIGVSMSDLAQVAQTIQFGHLEQGGAVVDWMDVPVTATASGPSGQRLYGLVPGSYGPLGSSLMVVDVPSRRPLAFVQLHDEPIRLTLSADGRFAYVLTENESVQQVDLQSLSLGWSWASGPDGTSSVAPRAGFPQQFAAIGSTSIHLVDSGTEVGNVARNPTGKWQTGTGFFASASQLVEFLPGVATGSVNVYQANGNALLNLPSVDLGFSAGGDAYWTFMGLGYLYNDAGDVADAAALTTQYSGNAFGNRVAFSPVALGKFVSLSGGSGQNEMDLNVFSGRQLLGSVPMAGPRIAMGSRQLSALDSKTVGFGVNHSGLGMGSTYIVTLPY